MKKQLIISALFDMSAFDKSVSEMQRKLKDLHAPRNMVGGQAQIAARLSAAGVGGITGPGQAAQERASLAYRKDLDGYIQKEYKTLEKLVERSVKRDELLKSMVKRHSEMTKNTAEELVLREKIGRVEETQARKRQEEERISQNLRQAADVKELQQKGPPSLPSKLLGMAGGPLGVVAGMAGAIEAAKHLAGYEQRLEAAKGSAIQGAIGKDLASVYAGRAPFEAAWMPERIKALRLAKQKSDRDRMLDIGMGVLGVGSVVGGLAIGAASIAGMPFSAGGSALGLGTAGAAITAGSALLLNDRARTSVLHPQDYQNLLAAQQATDFRNNLENLKKQDPRKGELLNHFEANYMRDIQSQRTLGLSSEGFRGNTGFLRRGVDAGFTNEMTIGMGNAIVGAGGSSRMGQQSPFALQMERGGLTNAAQLMGALSGGIQSPVASKDAMIAIMSEAFKKGLDNANYVEEMRRFASAATDIISRTGAATPEGQARLADTFGMFLGDKTNRGVQSAQTAYEAYQQRGSQLGGRRGIMRYSEALKNKHLASLDPTDLTELLAMRPEDLQSDPAALEYFRQKGGYKNNTELLRDISDIQKKTRIEIPGVRKEYEEKALQVAQYLKKTGMTTTEFLQRERQGVNRPGISAPGFGLPEGIMGAYGGLGIKRNIGEKGGYTAAEGAANLGEAMRAVPGINIPEGQLKGSTESLMAPTGKIEDTFISDIAKSADLVRQNFDELKGVLTKASAAAQGLAEATNKNASSQNKTGATPYTGAENQPQSTPGFWSTRNYNHDQK